MRARRALPVVALLAFAGAFLAAPPAAPRSESLLSALGRSLAGFRVMLVDGLFIRAAEAQRRGLHEDASALYRTVLDLEPDNTMAAAFLVDSQFESLGYFVDPDERFRWWLGLRRDIARTLALRPDAHLLHFQDAWLILRVLGPADPELAARVQEDLGRPEGVALERLAQAARGAEVLQGIGLGHLDQLAEVCLRVGARALLAGDGATRRRALAIGDEFLSLRGEALARIVQRLRDAEGNEIPPEDLVSRRAFLAGGLEVIRRIAAAQAGGDAAAARAALAAYGPVAEGTRALELLERAAAALD